MALKTTWGHEQKKLDTGAFGVMRREREDGNGAGKVRAAKLIYKRHLDVREVEALVELQGVKHLQLVTHREIEYPRNFITFLGWIKDPHAIYIAEPSLWAIDWTNRNPKTIW